MQIKPLRTKDDYNTALAYVEKYFDSPAGTDEFDDVDVLATLIQAYETKYFAIAPPDPIGAIEYEMEKRGLTKRDLEPILGPSGRVSEIMGRKRRLTFSMMQRLHTKLGIPAEILPQPYPINTSKPKPFQQNGAVNADKQALRHGV